MKQLIVDMKVGFGKLRVDDVEYSVLKADDMWNFFSEDYSQKYLQTAWIAENKKRFSTIKKYAEKYDIELIEG